MPLTRKRFGQHFLEPAWADKVVAALEPSRDDLFLEIGPGPGILTLRLAPKVSRLIAIEIDRDLIGRLAPQLPPNATIVSGDVLDIDLEEVLPDSGKPIRIAGNLPYNISSPILFRLLALESHRAVSDATVMLQREVADRLIAKPGTPEYGPLSVLVQWRAAVTRIFAIPPGAFRPPPDVRSALVRLAFRPPAFQLKDAALFERMVRGMFTQRRKTVVNALGAFARDIRADPARALAGAGIDSRRRPEALEIVEMARLADIFAASRH